MKAMKNHDKGRQGAALVTMMIVLLLVCLAGAAMIAFASQQAHGAGRVRDYLKAQSYAEAGINDAYNVMKTNFTRAGNAALYPSKNFGDGQYDVTVSLVSTDRASLVSIGTCGEAKITVAADVKNFRTYNGGIEVQPTDPYAYTWLVNGEARMNGSSVFAGYVHANNNINVNGSSEWGMPTGLVYASATVQAVYSGPCTLYGTLRSPSISGSFSPGSAIVEPSPLVPIPALDLTTMYNTALANGQVVGSQTISANTTWTIPGGVRWINGYLYVKNSGSLTYQGCVIATSYINAKGRINGTPTGGRPTLVSRDSYMDISHNTIRGVLYSGGDITFNGGADFTGTILCKGNLCFNGSGNRFTYAYYGPGGGGGGTVTTNDRVVITAWQK